MLGRRSRIEYVRTSGSLIEVMLGTSITYRICKDHMVTEVMLGRRSLIEYVRTTGHIGNARTSITYIDVSIRTTGHRGNARTSITYRVCKDTEVMLGRRSLIEYARTTGHRGNARTSITYRDACKDHRSQSQR